MVARAVAVRGDVHLVSLDPTTGSEIRKTRPCLVISPDELNRHLRTTIVAPMTTGAELIHGECSAAFNAVAGSWRLTRSERWTTVA